MQFSDVSGGLGLVQNAEFLTGIGPAQISGNAQNLKDFTRLANLHYHLIDTMILESVSGFDYDDSNKTDYPIVTADLTANRQDYLLPTKTLRVKRVEVKMDGSTWQKAEAIDINEFSIASDSTTVASNFNQSSPKYDLQSNALFLYPIPSVTVTGGLKIWVAREVTEFTTASTTTEPGFDEPFHNMIAVGAARDFCVAKQLPQKNDLAALYTDYETRLRKFYGGKEADRNYVLKSTVVDYN